MRRDVELNQFFEVRALEIHDSFSIWNLEKIRKVTSFMDRNGLNTLVLHENDIVDKVVYPGFLFGAGDLKNSYEIYRVIYRKIYEEKPVPFVFTDEKLIFRDLLKTIVNEAKEAGIEVYLQVKELSFTDRVFEYKPDLLKDGVVCPSDPFWWEEFLPTKYAELCENFPDLAGIVISTGTRESRASLAHGKCNCERCKLSRLSDWQRNVMMAIYTPLKEAGKKLVVRDFTYYFQEQDELRKTISELPDDIIMSIKNTPQDFYPTFPDNPLLGKVTARPQWVEYEVMGEYYGFGVAPCILVKDIQHRVSYALEKGASGFTARVDWEALPNHSCFDTPNLLNLYGVACLTRNPDLPLREIYRKWLIEENLLEDELSGAVTEDCIDRVMDILEKTWPMIEKSLYIGGFVFNTNSKIPINLDHADFIAREHHGMQKWFPERLEGFVLSDYRRFKEFLEEKDTAAKEAEELHEEFKKYNPGLKENIYDLLVSLLDFSRIYTKMFQLVGKVYLVAKYLQEGRDVSQFLDSVGKVSENLLKELEEYERVLDNYDHWLFKYPANVLVSSERVRCFCEDAKKKIPKMLRSAGYKA